jgi:SAM-dependent methyltransferase
VTDTPGPDAPDPEQPRDHWFEDLADHLGEAYLRYSFTKGTENEVALLVDALGLVAGDRVLDVGCGPGRHAHALGRRGIEVVGVDISARFIEVARRTDTPGVTFERVDARSLPYVGEFDAVISLCQGAFGLAGGGPASGPARATAPAESGSVPLDPDGTVLDAMVRALRPGGRLAVSAFSAYFQIRFLEDTDSFDAAAGVNHERTELRSPDGAVATHDLWTSCFTPRELRLLARLAGLAVDELWSVTPGAYRRDPPDLDQPELLLIAHVAGDPRP